MQWEASHKPEARVLSTPAKLAAFTICNPGQPSWEGYGTSKGRAQSKPSGSLSADHNPQHCEHARQQAGDGQWPHCQIKQWPTATATMLPHPRRRGHSSPPPCSASPHSGTRTTTNNSTGVVRNCKDPKFCGAGQSKTAAGHRCSRLLLPRGCSQASKFVLPAASQRVMLTSTAREGSHASTCFAATIAEQGSSAAAGHHLWAAPRAT